MKIRIASWNTWKNDGAYRRRLPAMVKTLQKLQPDVLLLQESFKAEIPSGNPDTAAYLAEALEMEYSFASAREKIRTFEGGPVQSSSGHTILSRSVLERIERRELITTPEGGERIALFARTQIQDTSLSLACVHFAHRRSDGSIRSQQFTSVIDYLLHFKNDGDLALIGGDFNMTADSKNFTDAQVPDGISVLDLHKSHASEYPTHPVPKKPGYPERRIDFLLALSHQDEPAPKVLDTGIAGTEFDEAFATYPSDHALIWADLKA